MKRIVAMLLVLCMTLGLAACGQKAPAPTEAPAASAEAAPAAETPAEAVRVEVVDAEAPETGAEA